MRLKAIGSELLSYANLSTVLYALKRHAQNGDVCATFRQLLDGEPSIELDPQTGCVLDRERFHYIFLPALELVGAVKDAKQVGQRYNCTLLVDEIDKVVFYERLQPHELPDGIRALNEELAFRMSQSSSR